MNYLQVTRLWAPDFQYLASRKKRKKTAPEADKWAEPTSKEFNLIRKIKRTTHYNNEGRDLGMEPPDFDAQHWISDSPTPRKIPEKWWDPSTQKINQICEANGIPTKWSNPKWYHMPPGISVKKALILTGHKKLKPQDFSTGPVFSSLLTKLRIPWRQMTTLDNIEQLMYQMESFCGEPIENLCICKLCCQESERADKRKFAVEARTQERLMRLQMVANASEKGRTARFNTKNQMIDQNEKKEFQDKTGLLTKVMLKTRQNSIAQSVPHAIKIDDDKQQKRDKQRLKGIQTRSSIASSVVASPEADEFGHLYMRKVYDRFASQIDGELDKENFVDVIRYLGHKILDAELIQELIENSSTEYATLSFEEFLDMYSQLERREEDRLAQIFDEYDEDHSGTLEYGELESLFFEFGFFPEDGSLEEIIGRTADSNVKLNFEEFITVFLYFSNSRGFTKKEISYFKKCFEKFDIDGSDSISAEEFKMLLIWIGCSFKYKIPQWVEESEHGLDFDEFLSLMQEYRMAEYRHIRKLFHQADTDQSGDLSSTEIRSLVEELDISASNDALNELIPDDSNLTVDQFRVLIRKLNSGSGFSTAEQDFWKNEFATFAGDDQDMDAAECLNLLRWMGFHVSVNDVMNFILSVDVDKSNTLSVDEFLRLIRRVTKEEEDYLNRRFDSIKPYKQKDGLINKRVHKKYYARLLEPFKSFFKYVEMPDVIHRSQFWIIHGKLIRLYQEDFRENACFGLQEILELRKRFDKFKLSHEKHIPANKIPKILSLLIPSINSKSFHERLELSKQYSRFLKMDEMFKNEPPQTKYLRLGFENFIKMVRLAYDALEKELLAYEHEVIQHSCFSLAAIQKFRSLFQAKRSGQTVCVMVYRLDVLLIQDLQILLESSKLQLTQDELRIIMEEAYFLVKNCLINNNFREWSKMDGMDLDEGLDAMTYFVRFPHFLILLAKIRDLKPHLSIDCDSLSESSTEIMDETMMESIRERRNLEAPMRRSSVDIENLQQELLQSMMTMARSR